MSADAPQPADNSESPEQPFIDSCTRFVQELCAAVSPEHERYAGEAYGAYAATLAEAVGTPPFAYQAAAAWQAYISALQQAFAASGTTERARTAYGRYLSEMRAAFAADETEFEPHALAAVAYSLSLAAWLAGAATADSGGNSPAGS